MRGQGIAVARCSCQAFPPKLLGTHKPEPGAGGGTKKARKPAGSYIGVICVPQFGTCCLFLQVPCDAVPTVSATLSTPSLTFPSPRRMSSKKGHSELAPRKSFPRAKAHGPLPVGGPSDLSLAQSDLRHLLCSRPGAFPETEESRAQMSLQDSDPGTVPLGLGSRGQCSQHNFRTRGDRQQACGD